MAAGLSNTGILALQQASKSTRRSWRKEGIKERSPSLPLSQKEEEEEAQGWVNGTTYTTRARGSVTGCAVPDIYRETTRSWIRKLPRWNVSVLSLRLCRGRGESLSGRGSSVVEVKPIAGNGGRRGGRRMGERERDGERGERVEITRRDTPRRRNSNEPRGTKSKKRLGRWIGYTAFGIWSWKLEPYGTSQKRCCNSARNARAPLRLLLGVTIVIPLDRYRN